MSVYGVTRESARERLRCESALVRGDVTGVAVEVDYPPTFTISRTPAFGRPVREGMTVSLDCDADVRPKLVGKWVKDDVEVESSAGRGRVLIDRAGRDDVGWYQCSIVYNGDEYSSIAYYLNVIPEEEGEGGDDGDSGGGDAGDDDDDDGRRLQQDDRVRLRKEEGHSTKSLSSSSSQSPLDSLVVENVVYTGGGEDRGGGGGENCSSDRRDRSDAYRVPNIIPRYTSCCLYRMSQKKLACRVRVSTMEKSYKLGHDSVEYESFVLNFYYINYTKNNVPHPIYPHFFFVSRNSTSLLTVHPSSSSSGRNPLVISFDVCSNPRADRVLWATPVYSLRPGQSRGPLRARPLLRSARNVTCHLASLEVTTAEVEEDGEFLGEYVLVAGNRHGVADAAVVLRQPRTNHKSGLTSGGGGEEGGGRGVVWAASVLAAMAAAVART